MTLSENDNALEALARKSFNGLGRIIPTERSVPVFSSEDMTPYRLSNSSWQPNGSSLNRWIWKQSCRCFATI